MSRRSSDVDTRITLGTYSLTRKDIRNLEKIMSKKTEPADVYILVGSKSSEMEFDSIRNVKTRGVTVRELRLITKSPNASIKFLPYRTEIFAQRIYRKNKDLIAIDETVEQILIYLESKKRDKLFRLFKRRNRIEL